MLENPDARNEQTHLAELSNLDSDPASPNAPRDSQERGFCLRKYFMMKFLSLNSLGGPGSGLESSFGAGASPGGSGSQ